MWLKGHDGKNVKILQLTYESMGSPFGFGGAGVRSYEIYGRLKERHDITLLCMKYPGARDGDIEDLRHIFVGTESRSLVKSVFVFTCQAARHVRRYGKDYDIIVENFLPATPFFSRYLTKTPSILQIQGIWGRHLMKKFNPFYGSLLYLMERIYPALHNTFLFVTPVNMEKLIEKSGMYAVIPNGIDAELLQTSDTEDDYILFLSRIDTYQKGLDTLLDAFALIAHKDDGIELRLAGYEFNSTSELFKRLPPNMRERAHYVGFVTGDDRKRLLAGAKVFVLPSRHEAHPISVMEALASGKAVLVSDIPELGYIREKGLGLTFRRGSAQDLSEKLIRLLEDRDLRKDLGMKGQKYASQFLWDDLALEFESFLYTVLQRQG
jgi:glycosyltransferase involved in cell wall biosynthesis